MRELGIDIETYSSRDLSKCGVYKYAEAEDFTILLFSVSVDHGPVVCYDFARGERLPDDLIRALRDPAVIKTAYNAAFERICISRYFGWPLMDSAQWRCTMVRAARLGLPLPLAQCAEALHLEKGKMKEGQALIRYFSTPYKGRRRLPEEAPDRWEAFKLYNIRDVEVEQQVLSKVRILEAPEFDERLYVADQRINDRGVLLDRRLAENASRFDTELKARLAEEAKALTGLDNPNSPTQIKDWLHKVTGIPVESLRKADLDSLGERFRDYPAVQRLLQIRREMGKTSNRKYAAMLKCVCNDGRIHGLLQVYGASRTGRWAGRLVQVQNLPQNHLPDLDYARNTVKSGDIEDFSQGYINPLSALSELIRTAFIAPDGRRLLVCDFSAIEARVAAWLSGERWVLDVFRSGGDVYCATASQMFGVPVERHGANAELRAKGKIAVLALGYGGGVAALEAMGGGRMGLTEQEMSDIVTRWRAANRHIVRFWRTIEDAAFRAVKYGEMSVINRGIRVSYSGGLLRVTLPSGRNVCYPGARIGGESGIRRGSLEYKGVDQQSKKWGPIRTYGGKLTENIVQAIARDILGHVILRAEEKGLEIVFHVHDEIVVEADEGRTIQEVEGLFSAPIDWCRDLPLKGSGYSTKYYLKD